MCCLYCVWYSPQFIVFTRPYWVCYLYCVLSYIHHSSLYLLGLIGFVTCIVSYLISTTVHCIDSALLGFLLVLCLILYPPQFIVFTRPYLVSYLYCVLSYIHHSSLYLLGPIGFVTCIVSNIHHSSLYLLGLIGFLLVMCLISTTIHCIFSVLLGLLLVLCLISTTVHCIHCTLLGLLFYCVWYPPQFIVFTWPCLVCYLLVSYIHNSSLYLLGLIGFVTCIVSDIHHSSLYLLGLIGFDTCIVSDIDHRSLYLLDLVGFVTCIVSNIHHNSLHSLDLVWFVILLCLISTTVHCIYSALLGLLLVLCLILYPPQFIVFTRPYWVCYLYCV